MNQQIAQVPIAIIPIDELIVNPCAWCLAEQGIPAGEGSHGICKKHADKLVMGRYWEKLQRVPNIDTQAETRRKESLRQ